MPYPLSAYRHRLAETAGFYIPFTIAQGSNATNQVVIVELISNSGALESSFLGNTWIYQPTGPNAGQCRRVAYNGLDNTTGTVTVDRAFPNLTPIGTQIEVYGRLPPVSMEGRMGLNNIVNRVLDECWTVKRCDVVATVADQLFFQLNNAGSPGTLVFPWLQAEDRIVDLFSLPQSMIGNPSATDQLMASWQWISNADNPTIQVGRALQPGDLLRIEAFVPMSWWINQGGSWLMPTTNAGLQAETDQGLIDLNGMEKVASAYIYDELGKWGLPDDQNVYRGLATRARASANQWKRLTLERKARRTIHWPKSLSVPSRWGYTYGASWGMVTRG